MNIGREVATTATQIGTWRTGPRRRTGGCGSTATGAAVVREAMSNSKKASNDYLVKDSK